MTKEEAEKMLSVEEKIRIYNQKLLEYFEVPEMEWPARLYEKLRCLERFGKRARTRLLTETRTEAEEAEEERRLERLFLLCTGEDINNTRCFFSWQEGEAFLQTEDVSIFDKGILVPEFKDD